MYRLESLVDLYLDFETALVRAARSGDREAGMKMFMESTFPERMAQIEKRLKENSTQDYLVGEKLSPADCLVCNLKHSFFVYPDVEK